MGATALSEDCLLERHNNCFKIRSCDCDCHAERAEANRAARAQSLARPTPIRATVVAAPTAATVRKVTPRASRVAGEPRRQVNRIRGVQVPEPVQEAVRRDLAKGVPMLETARRNGCTYEQVRSLKRLMPKHTGKIVEVDVDREAAKIWQLRWQILHQLLTRLRDADVEPDEIDRALQLDAQLGSLLDDFAGTYS